jgi:nicotinic acid phosphoribosyltransferase
MVYAVPESTPIFANEPILELVAPIIEGHLVKAFVMNQNHLQTVLASNHAPSRVFRLYPTVLRRRHSSRQPVCRIARLGDLR